LSFSLVLIMMCSVVCCIFLIFIQTVVALNCKVGVFPVNNNSVPIESTSFIDLTCPQDATGCLILFTRAPESDVISRQIGLSCHDDSACTSATWVGTPDTWVEWHCCTGDLCNGNTALWNIDWVTPRVPNLFSFSGTGPGIGIGTGFGTGFGTEAGTESGTGTGTDTATTAPTISPSMTDTGIDMSINSTGIMSSTTGVAATGASTTGMPSAATGTAVGLSSKSSLFNSSSSSTGVVLNPNDASAEVSHSFVELLIVVVCAMWNW